MIRRLTVALSLALLFAVTFAEIPSYFHVCGRHLSNPQFSKCVTQSVIELMPKLRVGIPELDIPSLEPLFIDVVPLAELDDFRAVATNVKMYGLSNFTVKHLNFDLSKRKLDIEAVFDKIYMESDYDVKAKILVPIHEKGPITSTTRNVYSRVIMKFEVVEHRGVKRIYFPSMTTKLVITDYTANFTLNSQGKDSTLSQAINSVLRSSKQEIIQSMTPNIEKTISNKVLELSNKINKHFTYDELFPDHA